MASVACENLKKYFGGRKQVRALDGLTLSVEEGEVFGLLGPNGSGKTTFVKCCLRIIFPTSGRLEVLGRRPGHPQSMQMIGYLPENPNFYDQLTGRSFLYYHAELAGIPLSNRKRRINEVLELVHLDPSAAVRRLRTYSKGMVQRIGLAQALIARPKLIFLDEPQAGLDPIGRKLVKDIMLHATREGATVLFSSHVLGDVEDVADRVAIIDRGKLKMIAPLNELILHVNKVHVRLRPRRMSPRGGEAVKNERRKLQEVAGKFGSGIFLYSDGMFSCSLKGEEDIPKLVSELASAGFEIYEVNQERLSLEEIFLQEFGEYPVVNPGNPRSARGA